METSKPILGAGAGAGAGAIRLASVAKTLLGAGANVCSYPVQVQVHAAAHRLRDSLNGRRCSEAVFEIQ